MIDYPNKIYGHRELEEADTVCPGRNVNMDLLRRKVFENMAIENIKFSRFLHDDVLRYSTERTFLIAF